MDILGISALYHDSAAALCRNGEIVAAAQEERFTRIKHDSSFPENAIKYCLQEAKINPHQLDAIVYYDNPILSLDRFARNLASLRDDSREMIEWLFDSTFGERLWVHRLTQKTLNCLGKKRVFMVTRHHLAHAASAFYPSPFKSAAILTMDGVGEWATTTLGRGEDEQIELLKEIDYPHSLGLLYSAFTAFCGFRVNSGDYKLMGLAPYGKPMYYDIIRDKLVEIKPDGSFRLNLEYFEYYRSPNMTNTKFADLFGGPARIPESKITRREMDLAASIQKVLEETVILLSKEARKITGEKNLVMAGGVALNCVANGKLLRENIFDDIWIQPAAGDAGGALGAALYATHALFHSPRGERKRDRQRGSYLGPSFDQKQISRCLEEQNAVFRIFENKTDLYRETAKYIANGKVIGFFNGRMEFGPRALGARSILADPRNPETQSRLNLKIKFRESFRPFAPSVLAEKAGQFFTLETESPYMLFCADVREELRYPFSLEEYESAKALDMLPVINRPRSTIPAVTHVDYSARVQTVHKEDNPDYHLLLKEFENLTECPIVVNTSFNVRGEPIVCSPLDAYRCFMRTEMDVLVIENFLLLKDDQPEFMDDDDWRDKHVLD